jgi:LPXTG-site transpeptidase (sortase) family protein
MKRLPFKDRLLSLIVRISSALTLALAASLMFSGIQNTLAAGEFTTTKVYSLFTDVNGNTKVNMGDTLQYTVVITNTSGVAQPGTQFTDTIDSNTTLVSGSLRTTPIARNDSGYSTVGNVMLTVSAGAGVLVNDNDPDGTGAVTVSGCGADATAPFDCLSTNGGNVSLNMDGSFTFNPAAGFSGTDSFTYTISDVDAGTDTATVSITVGTPVWFINVLSPAGGNGRFTAPFNSITNFNSLAADEAGDYIFIYSGSYGTTGITLLNNQQLIGNGVSFSLSPNLSISSSTSPTIGNITLANGNTVRGLNVSTNTGTAINGTNVGTLTINNVSVANTGGAGVSLANGTLAATFTSVSSTGGTHGINLSQVSGSFTSNGGTIQNATGNGVNVSNTSSGPLNFTQTNSTITNNGSIGLYFEVPSGTGSFGTITLTSNTISNHTNNSARGVSANIQGSGSISKIDIGSNTFTGNTYGIDLYTNGTASVDYDIHNNGTMNGTRTQVSIYADDAILNNGVGPTMEGFIRNNSNITASPTGGGFPAVQVISNGDGNITTNINNNTVANFSDTGIYVAAGRGTGDVNATITNNSVATTSALPYAGLNTRSGFNVAGETNVICINLSNNSINATGTGAPVADYVQDRFTPASTTFTIQGLTTTNVVANVNSFIINTDSAPPATSSTDAGTYTSGTCQTVSFAAAPSLFVAQLDQGTSALPLEVNTSLGDITSLMETASSVIRKWASTLGVSTAHASGETVNVSLGDMDPSQMVTITFRVTVDNPTSATQVSNQGSVSSSVASTILTDDPGVGGASDATVTLIEDLTPPTTSILSNPTNPGNNSTPTFTFSGSDNVTPSSGLTFECSMDGSAFSACTTPYTSPVLADGSHTFQVRAVDAAGNVDATPASYTWMVDTVSPDVSIEQAGIDPTSAVTINFTVVFNEPVTGFGDNTADISLSGSAGATTATVTETAPNNGTTYNVAVSGMTASGDVTASIPASVAADLTGNPNNSSSSVDNTVTYVLDNFAPTVTVEQATGQADPTGLAPILFTATFNEAINTATFTSADVTLTSTAGTVSASITEVAPNNGTTFEIQVTGMSTSGTVSASIGAGTVKDTAGNDNAASTSVDDTVTYDAQSPSVISTNLQASFNLTGPNSFMVYFSEEVNNPAGNTEPDDVTNPANYMLIEKGINGIVDTVSCAGGVVSDDVQVPVISVDYFTPPPSAKVNLAAPLSVGNYRIYICGTTSIVDLALTPLGGFPGNDYTFDFTVTAPGTVPEVEENVTASSLPNTGFAPQKITTLPPQPATLDYAQLGDIVLELPSLNVKSTIVGVPQSNGEWDVTWLGNNTGWLNGTAFPTWNGNSVLTAHVTNASGLEGPFAALKSLKYGDQIIIHMGGAKYVYEVRNSRLARPYSTNFAFESLPEHSYLTLITCQIYLPTSETYLFRRVVRAVLVSVENK